MRVSLKEICSKIGSGATPKGGKDSYVAEGISLIRSQNVLDYSFSQEGLAHINADQAEKLNNVVVEEGDVLINITGDSVARACIVDSSILPARVNQHVAIIRGIKDKVLNSFILYNLQMQKAHLLQLASAGATRNALTKEMLENIEIELPELSVQKEMVSVLDDIQANIDISKHLISNLQLQTRALYKSWFIDLDKTEGAIPDTWAQGRLGDIVGITTRSFSPEKNPDVIVEHYSIPAFDENHYPVFESTSGIKSNKYYVSPNSILVSKLNPETKRIWRPLCLSDLPICSTEFIVYEGKKKWYRDFIYAVVDSDAFYHFLCANVTGSTGSRQRAIPRNTLDFELLIPPESAVHDFCSVVTPLYELASKLQINCQKLASIRDRLLKPIMTGVLNTSGISS